MKRVDPVQYFLTSSSSSLYQLKKNMNTTSNNNATYRFLNIVITTLVFAISNVGCKMYELGFSWIAYLAEKR